MGTSNIYNGPKDKKNNNILTDEKSPWKDLKSALSKFLTNKSGSSKKILSNYIKCLGGNDTAISKSKAGYISGGYLIDFVNLLRELGLEKTLESYDIDFKGNSFDVILSELINKLSPESTSKEDCVARTAMTDTLSELYKYIEENNLSFEELEHIDEKMIIKLLVIFFSSYVFNKFMSDLESRFDRSKEDLSKLTVKENDIRLLIDSVVDISINKMDFSKKIDNPQELAKKILKDCYGYLEVFE